jgi:hypothetical protein
MEHHEFEGNKKVLAWELRGILPAPGQGWAGKSLEIMRKSIDLNLKSA